MNALPGKTPPPGRRDHLRAYLVACLKDNVLSWDELMSPSVLDRVLKTMKGDIPAVLADLAKVGIPNAMAALGMKLMDLAGRVGG